MRNHLQNSLGLLATLVLAHTLMPALHGASVQLAWDRSPDSSVNGYTLYYGAASRQYTNSVNAGSATSNTIAGLQVGVTYFFAVTARATNGLESDYSNEVSYRPNWGTNTAPVVSAGPDRTVTPPNQATLTGTVSDDGLPNPPAATTVTWSKVSGPGTVTFANVNAASTTAGFSTEGTYVLRFTASDGALSAADEMTVTVNPPPANVAPVANAGADQTIALPSSATLSGSVSDDGLPSVPGTVTVTWSQVSGPGTVSFANANALSTTANFSTNGSYTLRLSASDGALSASDTVNVTVNPPGLGPTVFRSPASITIADQGGGSPYPATLTVSGMGGTLTRVTLTLSNLSHAFPGDVDILLVGPTGQKVMIMSDAGEDPDLNNVTLSFSDTASSALPAAAQIVSGTFRPTDFEPGETLPAPAPAGPYATSLSAFHGLSPNGTWSLYVADDGPGDVGTITGGWSLEVTTGSGAVPPMLSGLSDQSTPVNTPVSVPFTVQDPDSPLAGLVLTGSSSNPTLVPPGNIAFAGTGTNRTLTVTPASGQSGSATITVTATDSTGTSSSVGFVLNVTVVNAAPVANAGADQTITLPAQATLSATVSDDGLPNPPGATTVTWSRQSGPGTVTFGNANALNTTAGFSTNGTYVLRLRATDGSLSVTDRVTIVVQPANRAPVVNAGPDQTVSLSAALALSGTAVDDGWPNPPGATTVTWSKVSGPGTVTFGNPNALSTTASFSTNGTYTLRLTASDSALSASDDVTVTVTPPAVNGAPVVAAGPDQAIALPSQATLSGSVSDDGLPNPPGSTTVTWSKVSGPGTVSFGNANAASTWASFSSSGTYVLRLSASDSLLSATDDVTITVQAANRAPVANAGPDQTITLPSQATLSGAVNDDGLPNPPGTVTTTWSKVSGPGTVSFGNANALSTWANFSTQGTYVLRLSAQDGALPATDDLVVTVLAANRAPVVNAGADQSIALPNLATLSGTVTDDGLPNPPATTTATWSMLSGPGTVSFANANAVSTMASFSTNGTYVLRLSASDSALSATDDLTVEVLPVDTNSPPVISAIPDQTIPEGEAVGPVAFTVADEQTPPEQLTLRATSSNKDVVRNTNIVLQGAGNNWTLAVTPAVTNVGTTTIAVSACDGSLTNTREFILTVRRLADMPRSVLTVRTNNFGTVSPDFNGSSLVVGKTYELRAVPLTNKVFAGWNGDLTCPTKKITFVMQSNLVLRADFAAHPYAGSYNGLFYEPSQVLHQSSGFFTAQVGTNGMFSATLSLAGASHALSGQFDGQGRALKRVKRSAGGTLAVALQLDIVGSTEQITGYITNGTAWVAALLADRAISDSTPEYEIYSGKYTLAVAGGTDPTTEPAGTGFGAVKVSPKGRVALTGELADGQAVSQGVSLSRRGEWPLYVSLYSGQGSLLGWITLTNQAANDMAGRLSWIKPTKPAAKRYPGGFTIESASAGSKYETNFLLNLTSAQVIVGGGNLSGIFTNTATLVGTNLLGTTGSLVNLGIDASSGVFRGSFVDPGTGRTNRLGGVVLPKANYGAGYVQGTNRTGFVLLEPLP